MVAVAHGARAQGSEVRPAAGLAEVVFGNAGVIVVEQERGETRTGLARAAEDDRVEVGAAEVARRLVLLGIADGAEGMLGLQTYLPQRRATERDRRAGEVATV